MIIIIIYTTSPRDLSNTVRNSFKCILYIELNNFQNTAEWIILSFLSTQKQRQKNQKCENH